ncbi:MAG: hypothetical protein AAF235_05850 [Planctomycetota bacterium]
MALFAIERVRPGQELCRADRAGSRIGGQRGAWISAAWVIPASVIGAAMLLGAGFEPGEPSPTDTPTATDQTKPATAGDPNEFTEPVRIEDQQTVATEVHLVLLGGDRLTGILLGSTDAAVTVETLGIEKTIERSQILTLTELPPVLDRYRTRKAQLEPGDTEGRLGLAIWLRDRGAFVTALTEIEAVIAKDPYNRRAASERQWLVHHIDLLRRRAERARREADSTGREGEAEDGNVETARQRARRLREEFPVLSREEINLLRVYEMDLSDPPRFVLTRDAIQRFINDYANHPRMPQTEEGREALLFGPETRVIDLMFRTQAREHYNEVRVREHPDSFATFQNTIHRTWLINSCASNDCHGGQEAGRLWLKNDNKATDATLYSNFLVLERFKLANGTPMLNYERPEESALLHLALPRSNSLHPHPIVAARNGHREPYRQFRSTEDPQFTKAVRWIRSMYQPRPDYPIEYEPPLPRGARESASAGEDGQLAPTEPVER